MLKAKLLLMHNKLIYMRNLLRKYEKKYKQKTWERI